MTTDLDTLLTALYVLIDDHVVPPGRRRPGHPKNLSGAELVCLAVAQVLLGARPEHHWTASTWPFRALTRRVRHCVLFWSEIRPKSHSII
ncbi:MAG: hypothetical protein JOY82_17125 [Streptosporangiaceae bacterium]|nr:hypothetical protein [Streptosporangiaceae bacterium]MBV9856215.1 hypothetical protein [Streptosporangiaceae bacterium]